jgi:Cdc6-like AAA superfamily ATPase
LKELVRLVKELPWKLVVIHPQLLCLELKDLPIVELKPYTLQELEEILRERVIRLNLPLSDDDIRLAAEEGVRRGGNARIALLKLAELAGLTASWQA